ncbi:hypothetical protein [uncultured Kordia sp.]|uniref:hypothetical protein n=1 Tax=uncultured Kordia sp. TaxID=507699 RepID=UPI002611850F|nr:hypothetical protein [uncultured Kordia sp.]
MKKKNLKKLFLIKTSISEIGKNNSSKVKGGSAFVCSNDCDTTSDTDTLGIPKSLIMCPGNPSFYPCPNENQN